MKTILVKEVMVPLKDYATVYEDATLGDAMDALENAQAQFDKNRYHHRAILVCQRGTNKVLGKISQMDVIRSLEPNYSLLGETKPSAPMVFSPKFLLSIMDQYGLWLEPLKDICRKAEKQKAVDVMYQLTPGEYVKEDSGLNEAVHQLIMGHHQSLLVSRGEAIVGILRLTDVFAKLCAARKEC